MQAHGVELGLSPRRAFWAGRAQRPPQPVGAPVQHEPHLIGAGLRAGRAVGGEMPLPALDVVFGLSPGRVELFVKVLATSALEIGNDVAVWGVPQSVWQLRLGLTAAAGWDARRPRNLSVDNSYSWAQPDDLATCSGAYADYPARTARYFAGRDGLGGHSSVPL